MLTDRRPHARGWFVFAAALVAVLLGLLFILGWAANIPALKSPGSGDATALAITTLALILAAFAAVVWWSDSRIQSLERSRLQADGSLRESEQRFRALLEGVPDLVSENFFRSALDTLSAHVAVVDTAGTILTTNAMWRRFEAENQSGPLTGGVGANYLEVCDNATGECAEEAKAAAAGIRSVLAGAVPTFSLLYPCHSPTEKRWFTLRVTRFQHPDGVRATIAHEDITHVKRSEEALRLARFSIDQARIAMCWLRPDGRIADTNHTNCVALGYTREEMLALGVPDIDPDYAAERWTAFVDELRRTGTLSFTSRHRRKNGSVFPVEITSVWLEFHGEQFIFSSSEDVTERKQAEDAIRRSEIRYCTLFETSSDAIFLMDLGGAILSANPAACRMHGYTLDELRSMRMQDLDQPEDSAKLPDRMRRLRNGESLTFEVVHRRKDGSTFPVEVIASAVEIGGEWFVVAFDRDISERKRAEGALRKSEEQLRAIIDNEPECVKLLDRDGKLLEMNPAGLRMIEADDLEQVRGARVCTLVAPVERSAFDQLVQATFRGEHGSLVFEMQGLKGTWRTLETHSVPIWDADHCEVRALLGVTRDITEQKRAEKAMRESEERLRLALTAGRMGIFDWDLATNTVVWSDTHYELFGYPTGDRFPVKYHHFADRIHPEDVTGVERAIRTAMENGAAYRNEARVLLPDGAIRWVMGAGEFQYDPDRRPVRMLGIVSDITDRKRAEADLLMRDRAIQAVNQGIVITDPNLPDNPVIYASPGIERMTGYSPAEFVGRNCRFLQGPDTDPAEVARIAEAVRSGESHSFELLNYRKGGAPFWNELSITPVRDSGGKLIRFVGIQTDVTARRSLQDQLRQAQKMDAIGQLAGGVAHDFNNLLTVINGYSELLLMDVSADHPQREPLAGILDAGHRAATLTQQLLAFSRQTVVAPRVLDVNELVASSTTMLRRLIGEDVALSAVLSPSPCRVRIDPGQLEQVLMNLAVNARDAMLRGGRLTIATNVEQVPDGCPDCPPGWYVRLAITDTGTGMSEEVKSRIFEPFFTTKGVGKGTGLGLAMVYGILRQAGGSVRVESEIGRGTTFALLMPEVPADAAEEPADGAALVAPRGSETILLAEDEDMVRTISRRALEMQGYTVIAAKSGAEGIAAAASYPGPIHLLVTDVVMPDQGGRELADEIRCRRPAVRVLYVSGYTNDAMVRHGIEQEVDAFLQKPFTPLTLARKVREVLDAPRPGSF